MYKDKKILAVIPARSGSKGLKDKNIKDLCGKPLIAYSIEAAKESKVFDEIIVSTDSEKYAEISKSFGAKVPFLRSAETSNDTASTWSVIKEVLEKLPQKYDLVMVLQPTSPLRTAANIVEAVELFFTKEANAVVSVNEFSHSIAWVNTLPDDLSLNGFIKPEFSRKRRQDCKTNFTLNGAIYLIKTELINENLNLYKEGSFAYVMDSADSIDIDTELDFAFAKTILKR